MPMTPYRIANSWFASTSSLPILTLPAYSPASCSTSGAIMWQGWHPSPSKSTTTAPPQAPVWEQALRQFGARLFEASPGLVTWIMLLAPAWIPIIFHSTGALVVAVAVLIFDAYWVLRAVGVVTGVYGTLTKMRRDMSMDWLARSREKAPDTAADPLGFYHLCVIPTYTEPYHVLERTVQAIVDANYPEDLKLVAIITRETDKPGWENVARLKEK